MHFIQVKDLVPALDIWTNTSRQNISDKNTTSIKNHDVSQFNSETTAKWQLVFLHNISLIIRC